jgi:ketosteroid isomerase-like protein
MRIGMDDAKPCPPSAWLNRLLVATNAHDLDDLVDCFAVDYVNEAPAHPARGFTGQAQVRSNWQQIFASVPDLTATLLRSAVSDNSVWSEWEMTGTRRDGADHAMAGVIIFDIADGRASWARFYLDVVNRGSESIDSALATQLGNRS